MSSASKERHEFLKQHGICIDCGQEAALPGKRLCGLCSFLRNESSKNWRLKCKQERLCIRCKKPLPEGYTKVKCEDCNRLTNNERLEREAALKQNGICISCRKRKVVEGSIRCEVCRNKIRENALISMGNLKNSRKKAGLCVECGRNKPAYGMMTCQECLDRHRLYYRQKRKEKREKCVTV